MKTIIPIVLLFLSACGVDDSRFLADHYHKVAKDRRTPDKYVDPAFQHAIKNYLAFSSFYDLGNGDIKNMRRFEYVDELENNYIGVCTVTHWEDTGETWWTIQIKRGEYSAYQFKSLLMHELAHCVHSAGHVSTELHIMNPSIPYEKQLSDNWNNLVANLAQHIREGGKER